jgi:UPF0716 protein FxsA
MRFLLLLILIGLPLLEIYVLITVGGWIGAIPTIFLIVFTAVLGALLMRHQGLKALSSVQASMQRGEIPALTLLEGFLILVAGVLLLTPGFVTDLFGFLLLVAPLRRMLVQYAIRSSVFQTSPPPTGPSQTGNQGRVIDGEYTREKDK